MYMKRGVERRNFHETILFAGRPCSCFWPAGRLRGSADKENPRLPASEARLPAGWRWRGAASGGQPEEGAGESDVYAVSWASAPYLPDPDQGAIRPGTGFRWGMAALWRRPLARLGSVTGILVEASGFDDLCALYLQVLEDLWAIDPALNDGVAQLGLDLSQTRLSPAEQGAVGVALSWQRDCPVLTGTWEALADQGYIDRERVEWDDGLFLSLAEENPSGALTFTAQKWRSGTGAYWFTHCTARQNPSGHWDGYTVGGEAIS
ncbi:MAG: hypothetical protein ACLS43_04525 [Evtepia gabavorous]